MFSIRDVVVLSIIAVSLPICFMRPVYGILLWTVMAFLNPQFFAWGISHLPLALAVAIPTLAGFLVFSFKVERMLNLEVALVVTLWLWFTATSFNSIHDPLFAADADGVWYYWDQVSKIILMTVVTVMVVDTWNRLRWMVLAIAGSFGLLVIHSLPGMILGGGAYRVYGPEHSMISDNNDFGLALNMALPFFFCLAKTESDRRLKWIMGFLFMATIPAIIFTYSRGALVGLIAVLFCMLLQGKQKAILIPFALLVFLFAAFLTPQAWRDRMNGTRPESLDKSAQSRLNSWSYSWRLAMDNPIMGGGFDAFTPALYARYAPDPTDVHGPHSVYFGVLAEHGFVGLLLYSTLVISCFWTLRRIIKVAHYIDDSRSARYAEMLRFSLIGFLTSGAFLGRAYFDFFFSIVACVAILKLVCRAEWAQDPESEEYVATDSLEVGA